MSKSNLRSLTQETKITCNGLLSVSSLEEKVINLQAHTMAAQGWSRFSFLLRWARLGAKASGRNGGHTRALGHSKAKDTKDT